jgi:hypothetical protein
MNRSPMFVALAVAATMLTSSRGGLAAEAPDLVTTGTVRVESTKGAPLPDVHVHHEDGKLMVWGTVTSSPLPGHVDVKVFTPGRQLVAETQVVPTVVRRDRRSGVRWRFDAKLPVTPLAGAIVQVAYGFGAHDAAQTSAAEEPAQ